MNHLGTTLYTKLNPDGAEIEINKDRVLLAKLVGDPESMAALCRTLGVASLSEFQSYDADAMADLIDDEAERAALIARAPAVQWFDPAQALPIVRALREYYAKTGFIQEHGHRRAGKKEWEPMDRTHELLEELDDLTRVLEYAEKKGRQFRIYLEF